MFFLFLYKFNAYIRYVSNFKRITSFLLSVSIFMTHLVVLFHTLDHQDNHNSAFSKTLEFKQDSNADDCAICDVYLDFDFSELQSLSYSFVVPQLISDQILQQSDQFKPVALYFKQSRSPPFFVA